MLRNCHLWFYISVIYYLYVYVLIVCSSFFAIYKLSNPLVSRLPLREIMRSDVSITYILLSNKKEGLLLDLCVHNFEPNCTFYISYLALATRSCWVAMSPVSCVPTGPRRPTWSDKTWQTYQDFLSSPGLPFPYTTSSKPNLHSCKKCICLPCIAGGDCSHFVEHCEI